MGPCLMRLSLAVSVLVFCINVQVFGAEYDLIEDGYIDLYDIAAFSDQWLDSGCSAESWCFGADINNSGNVDFVDFALLSQHWLEEGTANPNLIGWWKFDYGYGIIAADSSGNRNNGTLFGDTKWVPGKTGGAVDFDGTGDGVTISNESNFDITGNITVMAWIKIHEPGINRQKCFVSKGFTTSWKLYIQDREGRPIFECDGLGPYDNVWGNVNMNDGNWYHLAGVYDGSKIYMYVNGALDNWENASGVISTNNYDVCIGENLELTKIGFNGLVDDVRIYNCAISGDEIYKIYTGGRAINPNPADDAKYVHLDTHISWKAALDVNLHDVYMGTSFDDVNNADTLSSVYKGQHDSNSYDPCGLESDTTYYWRIDEVNDNNTIKGNIWKFTTVRSIRDLKSDTWVATDTLGRELPGYEECGPPRAGKYVGIFYFLWLGQHGMGGPYDITQILLANPYSPSWGPVGAYHHWGQSELGYYLSTDQYVIRRHAHMLADAGVDVVFFDATNGPTYSTVYRTLCEVWRQIRAEGRTTPKIAFLTNSDSANVCLNLYNEFYSTGDYSELWFYWDGKPLILGTLSGQSSTVQNFFTIRYCWAWTSGQNTWNWLDNYPQHYGWHIASNIPEETSVCVAQHPVTNKGRSYHGGSEPPRNQYDLTGTEGQGYCFAEQWPRGRQIDPALMFVTGWNEWVAGRMIATSNQSFVGRTVPPGGTFFVDAYNQEYSRDIEPMKDGHTDNYYYQMIDGIRRYKGVRPPETASAAKTITVDGDFSDWADVEPEFRDAYRDTTHRNELGWGSAGTYINDTGRNDFAVLKVARDSNYVYFYAETDDDITSYTDSNWMLLFIDADQNHGTGWEGYDYLVNYSVIDAGTTTLRAASGGWNWTIIDNNISYKVSGNKLELRIPRSEINQGSGADAVAFDFHWADNIQKADDIIEFAVSGDSAPDRRFNYRYNAPALSLVTLPVEDFEGGLGK